MRAYLNRLSERDLAFVNAHAEFEGEPNACDKELARRLNVTRRTIINRRNRLRSKGVPLMPFRTRGRDTSNQGLLFN